MDAGRLEIVQAYADLYVEAHRAGRYSQTRQNDLWIAATAHAARADLYTFNANDFDWIDPAYVTVISLDHQPAQRGS